MRELFELADYFSSVVRVGNFLTQIVSLDVSNGAIYCIGILVVALILFTCVLVLRTMRLKVSTGKEGLIGKTVLVKSDFKLNKKVDRAQGQVLVMGELWRAEMNFEKAVLPTIGDELRVVGLGDGLTLILE